ncbi:hypothetical protein HYC85_009884 [Camellia sinensis]|uniref:Amine oxidase domain-containing protein n=1 Tax=Camellia sinensis TaxID=4442 RepID=A0A7J7HG95_CAMSI|nr:hypothetical protein HYC85_009884 [Camellia sinensis]
MFACTNGENRGALDLEKYASLDAEREWRKLLVYMFAEWYKPGCSLEYPIHGTGAVVDALVHGLQKFVGRISFKSHVENIVVENGRAVGVKLRSGQFVLAKKVVVSNASMWDTLDLLAKEVIPNSYQDRIKMTLQCESFMHLHLGFDAEGISEDLKIHHIVVNDWERGVDADQNVVLISPEPKRLDSGKDLIIKVLNTKNSRLKDLRGGRGLVAATEPPIRHPSARLADWRKSIHIRPPIRRIWIEQIGGLADGYESECSRFGGSVAAKGISNSPSVRQIGRLEKINPQPSARHHASVQNVAVRFSSVGFGGSVLWRSVERVVGPGFNCEKCEVKLVGTPLTHRRFLRMNRGTYGPAI